jgi:signal transduction histidine kinase
MLVNLLSNAVKFTPEGGRITVRARRDGERRVAIQVADTGIGIPGDQLGRIFEEFQQLDASPSRAQGGIGLGLALTKRLAALLGAEIGVTSEQGLGSTFTVTVPVGTAPPEAKT